MNILVTGGAGYKGIKLVQALAQAGHQVTLLDNFLYGIEPAIFLMQYPNIHFQRGDIRNLSAQDVAPYETIYHLAGISGMPACRDNPHSAEAVNVEGTRHLVALLDPAQLLIYASTTSIYGVSPVICTEESPIPTDTSLYARTKYAAEQLVMERERSVALRFATLFGVSPRMRWELLPNDFTMQAVHTRSLVLFDSQSIRTFLHVNDAVRAYVMVLDHLEMHGQVYNVGHDSLNLSKRQIADAIAAQIEVKIIDSDLPDPDKRNFIISFEKIARLGFAPHISLEQGIAELRQLFEVYHPARPFVTI